MLGALEDRNSLYAAALSDPTSLDPKVAPVQIFGSAKSQFKLRVPPDDAAIHDLVRQAHVLAKREPAGNYEAAMRRHIPRLVEQQPVFWSKLWPAGIMLGHHLLKHRSICSGCSVLELGAGLGIGAVCAAMSGATHVVASDIESKGLHFAAQSAKDNGVGGKLVTAAWDWNEPPPPEVLSVHGGFDVVLVGDCIYQDEHAPRLGALLGALVRPGGCAVFSDSLERPYKDDHSSELRQRLEAQSFRQVSCDDLVMEHSGSRNGVAAGKKVRLLVFGRPRER
jgi:predicted nicotinamide N-methyase